MTSPDERTTTTVSPLTRRDARLAKPAPVRPSGVRWSRRRPIAGLFAILAAAGLAAASLAPAGLAMAQPVVEDDDTTVYAGMVLDAQSLTVDDDVAAPAELDRGNYLTYRTPKPTPTPEPVVASAGGSGPVAAVLYYTGGGSAAEWMAAAGIPESDWGYVDYIVKKESGWNPNATNKSSGACGLVQALPCSKVPGNGYDPVDNLRWGSGYANGRYGGWAGAYNFWIKNNWW